MVPSSILETFGSDSSNSVAAAMADALDGLSAGMFLVDASGRIVHANLAGRVVLAAGDVLRNAAGRLTARDAEIDRGLRDAFAVAASGNGATRIKGVAVLLSASDGTRHVAHVLALTCRAGQRVGKVWTAAAAVFVTQAVLDAQSLPEIIAKAYKLTPAELRTLIAIVEVGGVPEVAEALCIAESTVRTHLKRLFRKTATTRQADLVRIVAGFCNPLVG